MDQTFDKQKVVLAATQAIAWVKSERNRRVAAYNAQSGWMRFWHEATCAMTKHSCTNFQQHRLEVAERLVFKATNCEDSIVFLTDNDIDQIKDWWSA